MYYLQSRYYDPEVCRFINADNTDNLAANGDFASPNLYAHYGNNQVSRIDDGGDFGHVVAAAVAGGIVAETAVDVYGVPFWIKRKENSIRCAKSGAPQWFRLWTITFMHEIH